MKSRTGRTRFSVAFNGDIAMIPRVAAFREVDNIFGKLARDPLGGGRPSYVLTETRFEELREGIADAHRHGLKFIYR